MQPITGKYIISDPEVCHGQPTFRGTRIMVKQVLELLEYEMSWDEIVKQCHNSITKEAIAEALRLTRLALYQQTQDLLLEPA